MAFHRPCEPITKLLGDWGYHLVKVEVGVRVEEVAEDASRRQEEEATALLLQDTVHLLGSVLKPFHELGGEVIVVGVAGLAEGPKLSLADGI